MLPISDFARSRMERFGLTEDHVALALGNTQAYANRGAAIYAITLPDGRPMKVRVEGEEVTDVLTHQP